MKSEPLNNLALRWRWKRHHGMQHGHDRYRAGLNKRKHRLSIASAIDAELMLHHHDVKAVCGGHRFEERAAITLPPVRDNPRVRRRHFIGTKHPNHIWSIWPIGAHCLRQRPRKRGNSATSRRVRADNGDRWRREVHVERVSSTSHLSIEDKGQTFMTFVNHFDRHSRPRAWSA